MADVSVEAVAVVVGQIYEAAYDQHRWFDAIAGLRDLFGGSRSCIVRFGPEALGAIASNPDPELSSPMGIEAFLGDPVARTLASIPLGAVGHWPASDEETAFRSRDLWQDWLRPRDMHHGLVCNLLSANDAHWILDIHRGSRQEAFGPSDVELLRKIVPHVLRAGQIGRRLGNVSALASAFSHLPFGVFLVNANRHIAQMNEAAEAMLSRPDSPLALKDGAIVVSGSTDARELQRLVADACALREGVLQGTGGTLRVPSDRQRSGGTRLVLSVAPFVDARAYGLASERCAVIMVTEVAGRIPDSFETHIRGLFGLTLAEARLATALASGLSLKEATASSRITVKTGRGYLERIFAKTETRQQSELVALLKSTEPLSGR
ncbi:helix-turn-helix transcriptional regulator [Mesorhizobium sp. M7A.F.Ca.US.006.04.2.1]|uniref:helix-turn-helix transcriptional regulator n=1 Tax=unclassified Mesorhizobium TaxID=325217 RepID=UPI000FCA5C62|nr:MULTISPECIES: helix-turn-helix transcriptional regulator [unclassified Mesorhizobium]RVA32691.1 helix-turn-helix transcriptional regulator [Mesorhizobium sp. M7A.F.Ca.US.001.01.1.1]RUX70909.1 helix-turn-helix transcriptional regulator [Mesorhizobium sp. M7A.F.Ca.US.005.03.1.1]RUY16621.1 helix-turn-helix transcriptional regulator [Mesorhizobium sp. M7A.F.Ca.US.005.03.2.1]RUY28606.1 helix-turn-helix transcriptional regulator [Mesorhizobium sp. M7A.F.Ca.US.001.04.2.1]RUY35524.1 helix-turn-heli